MNILTVFPMDMSYSASEEDILRILHLGDTFYVPRRIIEPMQVENVLELGRYFECVKSHDSFVLDAKSYVLVETLENFDEAMTHFSLSEELRKAGVFVFDARESIRKSKKFVLRLYNASTFPVMLTPSFTIDKKVQLGSRLLIVTVASSHRRIRRENVALLGDYL